MHHRTEALTRPRSTKKNSERTSHDNASRGVTIVLLVLIETGMCIDRNRVVTITELNLWTALTQADGFRRSENPPFLQGLGGLILVRLLLQWPFLGATCLLAVAVFVCEP